MIQVEVTRLRELEKHLEAVERKLAADERVQRVKEVLSVGERTAERVVAMWTMPSGLAAGNRWGTTPASPPRSISRGTWIEMGGSAGALLHYLRPSADTEGCFVSGDSYR